VQKPSFFVGTTIMLETRLTQRERKEKTRKRKGEEERRSSMSMAGRLWSTKSALTDPDGKKKRSQKKRKKSHCGMKDSLQKKGSIHEAAPRSFIEESKKKPGDRGPGEKALF